MTSDEKPITMVWSGGDDYFEINADIVAISSVLPNTDLILDSTGIKKEQPTGTTKFILSIGGSGASEDGWSNMSNKSVDDWVDYFTQLKADYYITGIDWDYEGVTTPNVIKFIKILSKQLKNTIPEYLITLTIFGNPESNNGLVSTDINDPDAFDYIPLMLYNGGQWVGQWEKGWCNYFKKLESTYGNIDVPYIMGVYPKGGTSGECGSICLNTVIELISQKRAIGIALWCYGGWLGACSDNPQIIEEIIEKVDNKEYFSETDDKNWGITKSGDCPDCKCSETSLGSNKTNIGSNKKNRKCRKRRKCRKNRKNRKCKKNRKNRKCRT